MSEHISVMLPEVLQAMQPSDGEIFVDGTFGAGGYSRALLEAAKCTVYAIDRDPSVAETAAKLAKAFPNRFFWLAGNFGDMIELLAEKGVNSVNGIVLDIGVSSMQIDNAERGFSFKKDAPLDMRMSRDGLSAADIVNNAPEAELADIIFQYGEERKARQIARAIIEQRKIKPITTTKELADIARKVVRYAGDGIDPSTRTFQALRIKVNDELGELERALKAAEKILAPSGRLVVVSFHSLEDRIVKQFFRVCSGDTSGGSRHLPYIGATHKATTNHLPAFFLKNRKPVLPSAAEIDSNPRSRSAKLRFAIKN